MREMLEPKIGTGTANPAQAKQSPAMRNPGGQLEGLSSFKGPDSGASAGAPRRSGLPGQTLAGAALQTASHLMPPGPGSMLAMAAGHALTASGNQAQTAFAGDSMASSVMGGGNQGDAAVAQHATQAADMIRLQAQMSQIDNEGKIAGMLINQQNEEVSTLATLGNEGTKAMTKAVTGQ
ncbi:hypothetical protein C0Z18_04500 [Trinickia dabaoshanensis]|uniref:Uncharacterized protein n=2 Tax=Trinickia dabaoshanensis TaxID=564714 RepID=A0A2N7VZM3_9BURK|nr:hypothetical protein C0Z18_04500 [Trinickia dabaoshanensis]